jgi:hypothetical protein
MFIEFKTKKKNAPRAGSNGFDVGTGCGSTWERGAVRRGNGVRFDVGTRTGSKLNPHGFDVGTVL